MLVPPAGIKHDECGEHHPVRSSVVADGAIVWASSVCEEDNVLVAGGGRDL